MFVYILLTEKRYCYLLSVLVIVHRSVLTRISRNCVLQVTFEANVWSLGITIWEICEYGEQPYKNLSDDEVISQVLGPPKQRLQRPTNAAIYTDYM